MSNILFSKIDVSGIIKNKNKDLDILNIYVEQSTDVVYITLNGTGITHMVDPETGLPLTFNVWQNKYEKNK